MIKQKKHLDMYSIIMKHHDFEMQENYMVRLFKIYYKRMTAAEKQRTELRFSMRHLDEIIKGI